MRILEQSDSRMVLKDGNFVGLVIGVALTLLGLAVICKLIVPSGDGDNWLLGLISLLFGLAALLLPTFNSIIFDKSSNTLRMRQRNLFWNKSQQYDLTKIKQLELWQKNTGGRGMSNKLMCVFAEGNPISLEVNKSSSGIMMGGAGFTYNYVPEISIGDKISAFLNVPFIKDLRPPSVGETITAIKETFTEQIEKAKRHEPPYNE